MTEREGYRWRPNRGEAVLYVAAGVLAVIAALMGVSASYADGSTRLFVTPVWLLIVLGTAAAYLIRVRFSKRTASDERAEEFFDRE